MRPSAAVEPEVRGAGLEVAPVRVEVGAVLLDDEHRGAQAQGGVEVGGADRRAPAVRWSSAIGHTVPTRSGHRRGGGSGVTRRA